MARRAVSIGSSERIASAIEILSSEQTRVGLERRKRGWMEDGKSGRGQDGRREQKDLRRWVSLCSTQPTNYELERRLAYMKLKTMYRGFSRFLAGAVILAGGFCLVSQWCQVQQF